MFKKSKRVLKKVLTLATIVAVLTTALLPMSVSAYGPSILFTPASSAPIPGALYARAMQASNGKMYATFEQYSSGTPVFPIYESTNNGSSWTQVGNVSDTENGYGMRYQPFLYQLPQAIGNMPAGTLICAGSSIPSSLATTELQIHKSTDSGRTWTYVSTICQGGVANPDGNNDPVWEPFLLVANNKLICYYSDERDSGHNQKIVHQTTTDGLTWSTLVEDVALASTLRPGMPVVAKMANGQYIMTYEVVGESGLPCNFKVSSDPESWTPASAGTQFGSGGSPYVVVMPNGRVVAGTYGTSNVYVNNSNATGSWYSVATKVSGAYTRCLVPLANGRLFIMSGGGFGSLNNVTYGDMDIGSMATIKRLRSYNIANYFIRHWEYAAVLQTNVSPIADSQFRIVPGLADSTKISFESVNFPGYYLRHYEYILKVNQNDDTTAFKQDATFTRVAGLANSSAYSYQSYNFPTMYMRHYDNVIKITTISTDLDKQDATFYEN